MNQFAFCLIHGQYSLKLILKMNFSIVNNNSEWIEVNDETVFRRNKLFFVYKATTTELHYAVNIRCDGSFAYINLKIENCTVLKVIFSTHTTVSPI